MTRLLFFDHKLVKIYQYSRHFRSFVRNLETYKMLTRLKPPKEAFDDQGRGLVSTCYIRVYF